MKEYTRYLKICVKMNVPTNLRHWAWNMQRPGMINMAWRKSKAQEIAPFLLT